MPRIARWLPAALLAAALPAGCGGPSATGPAGPQPSHGGSLFPVGDGGGFVEVVFVPENSKAKGRPQGKVVAYFLNRDGSGPLNPAPTGVTFTDESGKAYPLTAKADGATFESAPVTLHSGIEVSGRLAATLGSETVTVDVRPR